MSNKEEILGKKLNKKELKKVSGGSCGKESGECIGKHKRNIYCKNSFRQSFIGNFPNCAKSVEEDSWCNKNDACFSLAVKYEDMLVCKKAWR